MGHAQGREGALELRTGIPIIGHGIMAKEAEAIGVDDQRQAVLEKETAEMLEMIPGRIGGDKDRAQKFSRMIIDGQEQGLLVGASSAPRPRDSSHRQTTCLLLNSRLSPFVPAPTLGNFFVDVT